MADRNLVRWERHKNHWIWGPEMIHGNRTSKNIQLFLRQFFVQYNTKIWQAQIPNRLGIQCKPIYAKVQ
jgi:hypothetical protein